MKKVDIWVGSTKKTYQLPENWHELSAEKREELFVFVVRNSEKLRYKECIIRLLEIDEDTYRWFLPSHWYALKNQLSWVWDLEKVDNWMIGKISVHDREYYPPMPDFSNVTWEEFIFADTMASQERWLECMACLWRPLKEAHTDEEEPRIPFTTYGANNRVKEFGSMANNILNALSVNYCILRKHMSRQYKEVFRQDSRTNKEKSGGWVDIYRKMLGEHIWEEQKFLQLPVPTVLRRLNTMIIEGKERELHAKRNRKN